MAGAAVDDVRQRSALLVGSPLPVRESEGPHDPPLRAGAAQPGRTAEVTPGGRPARQSRRHEELGHSPLDPEQQTAAALALAE